VGSTRKADREFELDLKETKPKPETVKYLTEIVLGLTIHDRPVMIRAEYEIGAEIYERMNWDEESSSEIRIPVSRIVRRASAIAFR